MEQNIRDGISRMMPISKTREAVIQKMGGPFDYGSFQEDLRQIVSEKEKLEREFKVE